MKLLIISVSAGSGHTQVANALLEQAKIQNIEAHHIDMMEFVSAPMRMAIVEAYDKLASDYPKIWKYMYKFSDSSFRMKALEKVMHLAHKFSDQKFYECVRKYKPTHIICTHPFPGQAISSEGLAKEIGAKLFLVLTDYGAHAFWLVEGADKYFVATSQVSKELQAAGVSANKVLTTGIPVRKSFFEKFDLDLLKKRYKVKNNEKVVLLLSGGRGFASADVATEEIVESWSANNIKLLAVAGKNDALKKKIKGLENTNSKVDIKVFGWVKDIHELMQLADVVVTKPGGSTVSECLVLNKQMVLFEPIPGQEEHNVVFVEQSGLGKALKKGQDIADPIVKALKQSKSRKKKQTNSAKLIIDTLKK